MARRSALEATVTRRTALSLLGATAAGVLTACSTGSPAIGPSGTPLPTSSPASPSPSPRPHFDSPVRGAGTWAASDGSRMLADSGAHWYYTWKPTPDGLNTPSNVEFVPMIAKRDDLGAASIAAATAAGTTLLGFNEPNHGEQANMGVEEALAAWPTLMGTGLRLGAPAVAGDANMPGGWLESFMAGVRDRGYRVDFIPVHLYGTLGEATVGGVLPTMAASLTRLHDTYGLPIWVTELAEIPWGHLDVLPDAAGQAKFLVDSQTTFASLPFVERYAWFSIPYWDTTPSTSLYASDGSRTLVGDAFRALP